MESMEQYLSAWPEQQDYVTSEPGAPYRDGEEGDRMAVVPLTKNREEVQQSAPERRRNWIDIASAAALLTGGALVLAGKRRAGTVAAASGAALMLYSEKDAVLRCLDHLPEYVEKAQNVLNQVESGIQEMEHKREKLHTLLNR